MSSELQIRVYFPLGADFVTNPELVFYGRYISFLRNLYCVSSEKKCFTCTFSKGCRFHQMTGEYFDHYPGILVKTDYFIKKRYSKNEELSLRFLFVGNTEKVIDSALIFFKEHLGQKIAGFFFCIKDYSITIVEEKVVSGESLRFISPVCNQSVSVILEEMISYYNKSYRTDYALPAAEVVSGELNLQKRTGYKIAGKYIKLDGYVGLVKGRFEQIPWIAAEYGLGINNCIGGGQFEIKDFIT